MLYFEVLVVSLLPTLRQFNRHLWWIIENKQLHFLFYSLKFWTFSVLSICCQWCWVCSLFQFKYSKLWKLLFCFCLPYKENLCQSTILLFYLWSALFFSVENLGLCLQGFNFSPRSQDSGFSKPCWQLGRLHLAV